MNHFPSTPALRRTASRGFSLIELMVAAAIGMVVALALTGAVVATSRQYSMISATVSAQNSAQVALTLIDQAGRGAGAGFFSAGLPICPTWNAYNGTAVVAANAVYMPVKITNGADATVSDSIVFTGGNGSVSFAAAPLLTTFGGGKVEVSNAWPALPPPPASGPQINDIAVVGAPGSGQPCRLVQVTDADLYSTLAACEYGLECRRLRWTAASGNLNNVAPASNPVFGYAAVAGAVYGPAVISRVGTTVAGFRQDAFRVECNSLVRYNAFTGTPGACTPNPLSFVAGADAIANDIVLMHAQYGISANVASDIVTSWVEPGAGATPSGATWAAPAAADVRLIKAIRVVMVARSKEPDGGVVTPATCVNGAATPVTNYGPCSFQDASAPVIDLRSTLVPGGRTWQNYRYRVHMAIIPLRSVLWSD